MIFKVKEKSQIACHRFLNIGKTELELNFSSLSIYLHRLDVFIMAQHAYQKGKSLRTHWTENNI